MPEIFKFIFDKQKCHNIEYVSSQYSNIWSTVVIEIIFVYYTRSLLIKTKSDQMIYSNVKT